MSKKNVSAATRALIIKTGYMIRVTQNIRRGLPEDTETKVKYVDIQRKIGKNHYENHDNVLDIKCVKHWWREREQFEKTGRLEHKPRSGRPKHKAFATEEKIEEVCEYAMNMPMGYHKADVMEKFDIRSKNTLDKYTRGRIVWVFSPYEHTRDNEEVKRKRVEYAQWALGVPPRGRRGRGSLHCRQEVNNAMFVDHKMVCYFGLNRRHCLQAKRIGADKSGLEPWKYELHNPQIMTYFACHQLGVNAYMHAYKRPKKRGSGQTVDIWKVDSEDVIEAFENCFIPMARILDVDYVICDGVKMQHTKEVRDMVEEHDIRIHPSACAPHNVKNGYPPYSHPFMPLDHRAFAPYQQAMSKLCKQEYPDYALENDNDSKMCFLFDNIVKVWDTAEHWEICANTIANYGVTCQDIIDNEGNIKGLKCL